MSLKIFSGVTARASFKKMSILVFWRQKLWRMISYKLSYFFARLSLVDRRLKSAGNLLAQFLALQAWISLRKGMVHGLMLTHQSVWQNIIEGVVRIVPFIHSLMIVLDIMKVMRMIALIQRLRILIALRTETLVSIDEHVVLAISIHVQVRSVGWLVYLAVWLFNRLILPVLIVLHSILVHFIVILIVVILFFIMIVMIHFTLEFLIRGKTQILIIHWIILLSLIDMITARLIDQRQRDLLIVSEIILIRWELLFVLTSGKCFVHVEKLYIMDSWVLHSIQ